jgi:hypothetical protein
MEQDGSDLSDIEALNPAEGNNDEMVALHSQVYFLDELLTTPSPTILATSFRPPYDGSTAAESECGAVPGVAWADEGCGDWEGTGSFTGPSWRFEVVEDTPTHRTVKLTRRVRAGWFTAITDPGACIQYEVTVTWLKW